MSRLTGVRALTLCEVWLRGCSRCWDVVRTGDALQLQRALSAAATRSFMSTE